jgi:RimJ/RimL family protein N-acetyltransferase
VVDTELLQQLHASPELRPGDVGEDAHADPHPRDAMSREDVWMRPELIAVDWPVRTARLRLRPAQPIDVESTWGYRRLPDVSRWLTAAPRHIEDYRAHFLEPERLAKTLVIEFEDIVIGDLMVAIVDPYAQAEVRETASGTQAELGWCLAPQYTGRGYAKEAVRELFRLCFEDLDLRRVLAGCFAGNEPSWRLMERLGMRRESHAVRESLHRTGEWLDGYVYALLRDEWSPA